jgi:Glycosyl hydrolase family 76
VALALPDPELARELLSFVKTGQDEDGGVLWVEGGTSRNTCSTSSAAWLASSLADDAFAIRAMGWLNATLRGSDGLYADHVDGGRVKPAVFSYNQGAPIAALQKLGRSGEANATARSSLAVFRGERLWHEPPPFLAIWFRALLTVPMARPEVSSLLASYFDRLLREALDPGSGLFTRGGVGTYDRKPTIDQAAIVQILVMRTRI